MRAPGGLSAHPATRAGLAVAAVGLAGLGTARWALDQHQPPGRCPAGMRTHSTRCCGAGQTLRAGHCSGRASSCSTTQELDPEGQCVARSGVARFAGGELAIGATDWDGVTGGERFPRTRVAPFQLDLVEVTLQRFLTCTSCPRHEGEPGLPVTNVSPAEAEAFCGSQGGRLPTAGEWVWAAAGASGRRFAWGNSGLVCRRAVFGLTQGPCGSPSEAQVLPDLVGSRPDGASPEGVLDLAGNVAEWTLEPSGGYAARGGSFRSVSAAELKSWATLPDREKALYIGFRCAYPL